ncbi:MAG: hypothetical protein FJW69_00385 [Actinobacteria bacterium]|nr:hypothetical protein [Actinomycetota bacterium]MBM3712036.1 hypothetical protein [Actinomycetota bacterium]
MFTRRSRLKSAINHKITDRIPIDMGGTPQTSISITAYKKLIDTLGFNKKYPKLYDFAAQFALPEIEVMDYFQTDVIEMAHGFLNSINDWKEFIIPHNGIKCLIPRYLDNLYYIKIILEDDGTILVKHKDGTTLGKMPKSSVYIDPIFFPYSDLEKLPKYFDKVALNKYLWSLPAVGSHLNLLNDRQYRIFTNSIKKLFENQDRAIVYFFGGSLFSLGVELRKNVNFYCDVFTNKKGVKRIVNKLVDDYLKILEKVIMDIGDYIEAVHFLDDFAFQDGLIIPPELYREIFKPGHKKMWEFIHNNSNCKILFHSCGSIFKLIPDLIDAGIDILTPIQTSAKDMEPKKLKREFGKDLVFWGGGCDTDILAFGTIKEVEEDVKKKIDILGKNGGFVFAPILLITAEVPPENIIAMYDTAYKFGFY